MGGATDKTCFNCRWCATNYIHTRGDIDFCKRYAPKTHAVLGVSEDACVATYWPEVEHGDFCGEFEAE